MKTSPNFIWSFLLIAEKVFCGLFRISELYSAKQMMGFTGTRIYSHITIRSGGPVKFFKYYINFLFFFTPKQAWKHIWPNWRDEKSNCRSQFQVAPSPNDGWLCPETTGICRSKMERYWTNWSEVSFDIQLLF